MRAGLVRTFVQVPEVERVTFLIDGDPLKDSKGREIGTMTADSFLEIPEGKFISISMRR